MEKQMKLFTLLTKPFVLFVLLFALGVGSVWGWDLADGRSVYFDMQGCTDFGTPYFRIGRHDGGDWSAATQMTLVSGTKYLYIYTQSGKWENYGAFSVADGKGFTNSNNIYQPWSGQPGSEGYSGDVVISKQTYFQKYAATSDAYIKITGTGNSSNGCQYYQANGHTTDDGGALTALPSYSVTYNTPDHGTLTVTRYDGSSYNSFSSGADDFKPTEIIKITTSAATHYVLDELEVVGATQIESGDTYYVTANCTITATFAPQWSINGTMTSPAWDIYNGLEFVSGNTYRGEITLAAGTAYNFKVLDRATNTWYGCGTRDNDYTYVGQTDAVPITSTGGDGHNVMLMTTKAGSYTFEWNDEDQTLKITYPSAIVHPSFDYVYIEKYTGGGAWGDYYMHYWYTDGEGDHPLTTWGTDDAKMTAYTHIGNTDYYYFPILADYPKFVAKNNVGNESNNHKTDNMVTTGHAAQLVYWKDETERWTWKDLTVHIALNDLTPTTAVVPTYLDVAFNSAVLTDLKTVPTKTHYDFGGFYTGYDEVKKEVTGVQVINAAGKWIASVSDYTDASKHWIHEGDTTTLYAKWTEHEYTITTAVSPAGAGSVSCGSSTTAKYVTASGDITATANSGYSFREWGFSKVGEDDYDVYVSDGKTYSSTSNPIKIKAQRDGTLTANFTANGYTVTLEDRGADEGHKGTPNVSVTYDATTNLTSAISKPEKTYYTFDGYWTSNDEGETPITQLIDANGNWKKSISGYTGASGENPTWKYAGNITLYAKWIETKHKVQVAVSPSSPFKTGRVEIGGSEVTEVSVGKIIPTAAMTAVAANDAFLFKEWQLTEHISRDEALYSANANPNSFFAEDDDQTITAVFQTRFGVIGSLKNNDAAGHGMPGWVWSNAVGFDVNGFTDFGEGTGKGVDFRYSTTLDPNTQYKFRLYDRIKDKAIGCAAEDVLPAEDGGGKYHNWQLNYTDDGQDILINTTGRGTYTFHITNISADSNFWPSIQVDRPTSYQLNLGWGYVETVDLTTVKSGNVGGTVTAVATEGGEENPITNGGWVVAGGTITFTPHPADDYEFAGWFTSSDYSTEFGDKLNPLPISSISGTVNVYAKFVEKSTTFEGDVVGHETEWNNTGNWSGGALPTINDIAIITKPVTVDIAHATAKSIVLDQNSHTGKLTIQANKGLEVAGTITRTTDGSDRLATRPEDLILESSSAGNASLIFNNSNSCQATVQMYSIGDIVDANTWNWQFMGTPFTSANALYSYYGSYLYEWKAGGYWDAVANGGTMTPFTGYCITQDEPTYYVMDGTLNPTTSKTLSVPAGVEMVFANSWSAPISVCNFTETTLPLDNKTIYLFNTGYAPNGASEGTAAGTYIAMPINSAIYTGNYLIAPMEGFYVDNTSGSAATITLKYDELVRPSGSHTDIVAGAMHAPKRVAAEAEPDVMKIKATGSRYSERIVILERGDFSTGFDNGWDGKNLNEPGVAPILYALRDDGTKDAVSAIPTYEGTVVGFRIGEDNNYTFSFNYDGEDIWYLNDLKEEKSTLIDAANTYSFVAEAGDAEARFIISATPIQKLPTGIGNDANDANDAMVKVRKLIINDQLFIIRAGRMYNAVGSIVK